MHLPWFKPPAPKPKPLLPRREVVAWLPYECLERHTPAEWDACRFTSLLITNPPWMTDTATPAEMEAYPGKVRRLVGVNTPLYLGYLGTVRAKRPATFQMEPWDDTRGWMEFSERLLVLRRGCMEHGIRGVIQDAELWDTFVKNPEKWETYTVTNRHEGHMHRKLAWRDHADIPERAKLYVGALEGLVIGNCAFMTSALGLVGYTRFWKECYRLAGPARSLTLYQDAYYDPKSAPVWEKRVKGTLGGGTLCGVAFGDRDLTTPPAFVRRLRAAVKTGSQGGWLWCDAPGADPLGVRGSGGAPRKTEAVIAALPPARRAKLIGAVVEDARRNV